MMMSSLAQMDKAVILGYLIVAALFLALSVRTKDYRALALLGLPFAAEFIEIISHSIILIIAAIVLSKNIKPLSLLLLGATMLLPPQLRPFAYFALVISVLEEYLSEPDREGHLNFSLSLGFLYFSKGTISGPGIQYVGEYVAIIYSLRLLFWAHNLKSSIKVMSSCLSMMLLLSESSPLSLTLMAVVLSLLLFQECMVSRTELLPSPLKLRSLFYQSPKVFFASIFALTFGPILLMGNVYEMRLGFYLPLAAITWSLTFALFSILAEGLVISDEQVDSGQLNERDLFLGFSSLFGISVIGNILIVLNYRDLALATSFVVCAIVLSFVGMIYGAMRLWLKNPMLIAIHSELLASFLKNGKMAARLESNIEPAQRAESQKHWKELVDVSWLSRQTSFPYLIFLFLVIITSIVLLLKEMHV